MSKAKQFTEKVTEKREPQTINESEKLDKKKTELKRMGFKPNPKGGAVGSLGIWDIMLGVSDVTGDELKKLMKDSEFLGISLIGNKLAAQFDLGE